MNGSDFVEMTLNIGGESFKLNARFDQQNAVRDAEFAARDFFNKLRKKMPNTSERVILAMTAYQFALWHQEALTLQKQALELAQENLKLIDNLCDKDILSKKGR